ncbi:hypothetical protein [uncultured Nocardioides sp.]|uniref:hypothetical protein n=1 Tax=uncultured Nocardioides sp. TaxID=198441 RepID=UPI002635405D|nr:hypothetical protein [uncultured Nocardioides sp.]
MTTTGIRPTGSRVLTWVGVVVLLAIGLPLAGMGLLGVHTELGRGLLCGGLVLVVSAAGALAREVAEARVSHDPPQPRIEPYGDEDALHLPRASGPTLASSWTLAGLAAVTALGAIFAALEHSWVWACVLAAGAAWLGWSSAVHLGARLAGGLWLTPTRLVHADRGATVEAPWETVTGVVPQQPMPIVLRANGQRFVVRTGPPGRAWRPVSRDGTTLTVDTRHLAGGTTLASYVIAKAITDPAARRTLGTPDSLPPD